MLWSTLWGRIGRQPLSFSQHNHVRAVINDETIYLDLKYDAKGRPYLVRSEKDPDGKGPGTTHGSTRNPGSS